jgi:hypothetical protein
MYARAARPAPHGQEKGLLLSETEKYDGLRFLSFLPLIPFFFFLLFAFCNRE